MFGQAPIHHPIEAERIPCGPLSTVFLSQDKNVLLSRWPLQPEELEYAQTLKAPARRLEFERTRWLIKECLQSGDAIKRDQDGVIAWPAGISGSVSHKGGDCAIVLANSQIFSRVGIDLESVKKVKRAFAPKILMPQEISLLEKKEGEAPYSFETLLTTLFSFKESLFKAHFPEGRTMFYFHDAFIEDLDWERGRITATLQCQTTPTTPAGTRVIGHFTFTRPDQSQVMTLVADGYEA